MFSLDSIEYAIAVFRYACIGYLTLISSLPLGQVRSQNELINGMEGQMFDAGGLLGGTLRRINTMMAKGGSRHMCYLVAFIVFTFVAIWYILKHSRGGR